MMCSPHEQLLGRSNRGWWDGRRTWHAGEKRNGYRVFVGELKKQRVEDLVVN